MEVGLSQGDEGKIQSERILEIRRGDWDTQGASHGHPRGKAAWGHRQKPEIGPRRQPAHRCLIWVFSQSLREALKNTRRAPGSDRGSAEGCGRQDESSAGKTASPLWAHPAGPSADCVPRARYPCFSGSSCSSVMWGVGVAKEALEVSTKIK